MSLQNALLGESTNEQGLYDAQVHSLQIYKEPTLPTDVVNLASFDTIQLPPFIEYVNINNLVPDYNQVDNGNTYPLISNYGVNHPLYGVIPNLPYFDTNYWVAGGIGFSNTGQDAFFSYSNSQFYQPVVVDIGGVFVFAMNYNRTYELGIQGSVGTDDIWAQVVLKSVTY